MNREYGNMDERGMPPLRLCEGMRKSIVSRVTAIGGGYVANRASDVALLFDSPEYSNIPNINITADNAIELQHQLFNSLSQTVMHDLMRSALHISKINLVQNNALLLTFHNTSIINKSPIRWELNLSTEQLYLLRDQVDKAIEKSIDKFTDKL